MGYINKTKATNNINKFIHRFDKLLNMNNKGKNINYFKYNVKPNRNSKKSKSLDFYEKIFNIYKNLNDNFDKKTNVYSYFNWSEF